MTTLNYQITEKSFKNIYIFIVFILINGIEKSRYKNAVDLNAHKPAL